MVAVVAAAESSSSDDGTPRAAAALVKELGDPSFEIRSRADEALRELGLEAQAALTTGLSHDDPEVRRRCRWILEQVLQDDFLNRLDAFVADSKGEREHDLPGWQRFQQSIGKDAAAREFYAQMLRRESVLLVSASSSPLAAAESATLRLQQVYRQLSHRDVKQRKSPDMETVAALLFVVTDPETEFPDEVADSSYLASVVQQATYQKALTSGKYQAATRKLLGEWLVCPTGPRLLQIKLRMAMQHRLPEGAALALSALEEGKALAGHIRAYALATLGQIGGKPYASVLAEFLDDETQCYRRTVNSKSYVTQGRDVALAWLVHLTGQSLDDYGLKKAAAEFKRLEKSPRSSINLFNLGFEDETQREPALKRWGEWVEKHPLPEKPKDAKAARASPVVVLAPVAPPAKPAESPSPQGEALLIADRLQLRALETARELIRQKRYSEAAGRLGGILMADDDYTIRPDPAVPLLRCLKPEAERLLGSLPSQGLAAYQLQFGAAAERALGEALRRGGADALEDLVERYFYTHAGAEAALLLALDNLDRGHWQRAALYLERLRQRSPSADEFEPALSLGLATCLVRVDRSEQARHVLQRLARRQPGHTADIGGQSRELFAEGEDPLVWLESLVGPIPRRGDKPDWLVFRGGPGRNALSPAGGPYLSADRLSGNDNVLLEQLVGQLRKEQTERHLVRLPKLHPLVVQGTALARTPTHLRAIDSASGKLRWETALEDSLDSYLRLQQHQGEPDDDVAEHFREGLSRRLWRDASFGRLSSDGRRVFGVEGLSFYFSADFQRLMVMPDGSRRLDPEGIKEHNLLTAYDVETGKLVWEIGGPADAVEASQPGTLFFGPPLPLGGRLYAMARLEGDTRLLELDASTGELLWDLVLPTLDGGPQTPVNRGWPRGMPTDSRQTAALSPSYAHGILVCPTAEDHLVAVDLATRSVVWFYETRQLELSRLNLLRLRRAGVPEAEPTDHWVDNSITVADGRVLHAPLKSDKLTCLNLADGQHQWSIDRRDGLYVAGVFADQVVVVGHGSVWAVHLDDGKPAWAEGPVRLPPGALPAGRGYLADGHYYLPLATGEVAAIDVRRGCIASRARSADGTMPGNLVRCGDAVYSQNVEGLWRFEPLPLRQARLAEALRDRPGDAGALADYGETLLYQGEVHEAIEQLRQAAAKDPSERVRNLLVDALIDVLRTDFADFEPLEEEFSSLVEQSGHRPRLLQHLAEVLCNQGRHLEALQTYLELVELNPATPEPRHYGAAWMARCDRWISGRLTGLWADASSEDRQEIAKQMAAILDGDGAAGKLPHFGFLPPAQGARLALAGQLANAKKWIAAQQQMNIVLQCGLPEQQREATARMAALMRTCQRYDAATCLYRELSGPLADLVCFDGQTGRQLVDALPADGPLRRLLETPRQWPSAKVEKEVDKKSVQLSTRYVLRADGAGDQFATMPVVELDTAKRLLIGHDGMGSELWNVALKDPPRHIHHSMLHYGIPARRVGHLIVVHLGDRVCAIDTLVDKGSLLWSRKTASSDSQAQLNMQMLGMFGAIPNNPVLPGSLPMLVAAAPGCVAFQRDRELLGVDPLSGETLWSRGDLPPACDLFGDKDILLATPPGAEKAVVISMLDGRQLGRCIAPRLGERVSTCGHRVVRWSTDAQGARLALEDLPAENTVWERRFAAGSQPWLVGNGEVAVLEPEGSFVVLSVPGGRPLLEARADAVETLEGICVLRSAGSYVLMANRPRAVAQGARVVFSFPGRISVNGTVYGFDRQTGKRLWSAQLEQQSIRMGQPANVPVLTFFSRVRQREGNKYTTTTEIVCIDKRTGKILHQEKTNGSRPDVYEVLAKPDQGRVEIRTHTGTIRFQFS